jgi:ketosteroid isomerase-like protein
MDKDILDLSRDWAAAELRGDADFLERNLAPDFTAVGPLGFILTKADWLDRIKSGALRYQAFDLDDVSVREYDGAALAIGKQTTKATYQGNEVSGQFRATEVFVQEDGRWLAAGIHLSPIQAAPAMQGR